MMTAPRASIQCFPASHAVRALFPEPPRGSGQALHPACGRRQGHPAGGSPRRVPGRRRRSRGLRRGPQRRKRVHTCLLVKVSSVGSGPSSGSCLPSPRLAAPEPRDQSLQPLPGPCSDLSSRYLRISSCRPSTRPRYSATSGRSPCSDSCRNRSSVAEASEWSSQMLRKAGSERASLLMARAAVGNLAMMGFRSRCGVRSVMSIAGFAEHLAQHWRGPARFRST